MITHRSIGYSGRLGNQMFQYAAIKSVSIKNGYECVLPNNLKLKDDGTYDFYNKKWIPYKLDLIDCFKITSNIIDNNLSCGYIENKFQFDKNLFNISDNISIDGYFQSYKYFEDIEYQIHQEFSFNENILFNCNKIINNYTNPVSIHVRRGDYVNNNKYWSITQDYIINALNILPTDNYTFLIFSDDIEWCKSIFSDEFVFIENTTEFEDMCLMTLCNHNIISNSTFGWWGAWLNKNSNKIVIAPSKWFNTHESIEDLYPPTWTII